MYIDQCSFCYWFIACFLRDIPQYSGRDYHLNYGSIKKPVKRPFIHVGKLYAHKDRKIIDSSTLNHHGFNIDNLNEAFRNYSL